ncbi:MAG TPA: cytochrome c [Povalibacter sp.]|uniref:c-type cytochrome n=1 Tax=Povalibacter sp. TaxID=1962978 RepID=UPI002C689DE8|nr:cytochrome c [Povalibacter sp.]HMN46362.1 cytochrome c [Povalibacter sp.]
MTRTDSTFIRTMAMSLAAAALLSGCSSTRVDDREAAALSGVELYERLCSSCHGDMARGDGPVAPLIKTGVPDLTLLARRDGGEFPTEDVRRAIDGRWDRHAHGARDMPVWGWQLFDMSSQNAQGERAQVDSMIDRLVNYLQSVQRP